MEPNNSQPPKVNSKVDALKNIMRADTVQEQFRNALKENSGAFIASVIDLYNSDTGLQECPPQKVVTEALKAAVLKLPINKALGFAYVIKFNNRQLDSNNQWQTIPTPTFILGYKGYIQLAMRTGFYRTINADKVFEGEIRKLDKLTGEVRFDGEKKSDKVIGYFAYMELLNGFSKTLYISVEDMAKHAKKYSPTLKTKKEVTSETLKNLAGKDPTGIGWQGGFDDMALKTVIRQLLSKYGYLSVEMQTALTHDIESDMQHPQITGPQVIDIDADEVQPENKQAQQEEQQPPYL